jgi:hypothetical protein
MGVQGVLVYCADSRGSNNVALTTLIRGRTI